MFRFQRRSLALFNHKRQNQAHNQCEIQVFDLSVTDNYEVIKLIQHFCLVNICFLIIDHYVSLRWHSKVSSPHPRGRHPQQNERSERGSPLLWCHTPSRGDRRPAFAVPWPPSGACGVLGLPAWPIRAPRGTGRAERGCSFQRGGRRETAPVLLHRAPGGTV